MVNTTDTSAMKPQPALMPNYLPESFQPTKQEVVIGRGRKIEQHAGNLKLRSMVSSKAQEYVGYADKTMKSRIISSLGNQIKSESQFGGFVKKDPKQGRWFVVSESCVRATIAQAFRDRLSPSYKSSKFSKQRRRWTAKEETEKVVKEDKTESSSTTSSNTDTAAGAFHGTFFATPSCGDAFLGRRDSLLGFQRSHQRAQMFRPVSSSDACLRMPQLATPSSCVGSAFTAAAQGTKPSSTSDILRRCLDVLEEDDDFFDVFGNPYEPTPIPDNVAAQPFLPDDEDLWMI